MAVADDPEKAVLRQQHGELLQRLEVESPTAMLLRGALESAATFVAEHQRLPRRGRQAIEPGEDV